MANNITLKFYHLNNTDATHVLSTNGSDAFIDRLIAKMYEVLSTSDKTALTNLDYMPLYSSLSVGEESLPDIIFHLHHSLEESELVKIIEDDNVTIIANDTLLQSLIKYCPTYAPNREHGPKNRLGLPDTTMPILRNLLSNMRQHQVISRGSHHYSFTWG